MKPFTLTLPKYAKSNGRRWIEWQFWKLTHLKWYWCHYQKSESRRDAPHDFVVYFNLSPFILRDMMRIHHLWSIIFFQQKADSYTTIRFILSASSLSISSISVVFISRYTAIWFVIDSNPFGLVISIIYSVWLVFIAYHLVVLLFNGNQWLISYAADDK